MGLDSLESFAPKLTNCIVSGFTSLDWNHKSSRKIIRDNIHQKAYG